MHQRYASTSEIKTVACNHSAFTNAKRLSRHLSLIMISCLWKSKTHDACEDKYLLGESQFVALAQLVFQIEGGSTAF